MSGCSPALQAISLFQGLVVAGTVATVVATGATVAGVAAVGAAGDGCAIGVR